jgi:hypothetical protein
MRTDILLANNDLSFEGNDLHIGLSDDQHTRHLLEIESGDLTQNPKCGVGIFQYLKGGLDGAFRRNIQLQFEGDGYILKNFDANSTSGAVSISYKLK